MNEEIWRVIPEFPNYEVSNFGNIYNIKQEQTMSISYNNYGHAKITLTSEWDGRRFTRSVAVLVAQAFVEAPNLLCDQVVLLDGDFTHIVADNLVWRPQWFAWKYARQLKEEQPRHFMNLEVCNVVDGIKYPSIVDAGMHEGLLFKDIWMSTYTGNSIFPTGKVFEIIERV